MKPKVELVLHPARMTPNAFVVERAVNTTSFQPGAELTEKQVDELIHREGVRVVIKGNPGR